MYRRVQALILCGSDADADTVVADMQAVLSGKAVQVTDVALAKQWNGMLAKWTVRFDIRFVGTVDADAVYNDVQTKWAATPSTTARFAPDTILAQANLNGAVTAVQDDPDAQDTAWLTAASHSTDTSVRVSFPTPSGSLVAGAAQEIRVRVRKSQSDTLGSPSARVELWEAGAKKKDLVALVTVTQQNPGTVLAGTFTDADLTGKTGAGVEVLVYGQRHSYAGASVSTVEPGAVEWNATYQATSKYLAGSQVTKHDCHHDEQTDSSDILPATDSNLATAVK